MGQRNCHIGRDKRAHPVALAPVLQIPPTLRWIRATERLISKLAMDPPSLSSSITPSTPMYCPSCTASTQDAPTGSTFAEIALHHERRLSSLQAHAMGLHTQLAEADEKYARGYRSAAAALATRDARIRELELSSTTTPPSVIAPVSEARARSRSTLAPARDELEDLAAATRERDRELKAARDELEDLRARLANADDALRSVEASLKARLATIDSLQAQVLDLEELAMNRKQLLSQYGDTISSQLDDIQELAQDVEDHKLALAQRDATIDSQRDQIQELEERVKDRDRELVRFTTHVETQTKELGAAKSKFDALATLCVRYEARARMYRARLGQCQETIAELQSDRDVVTGTLMRLTGTRKHLPPPVTPQRARRDSLVASELPLARSPSTLQPLSGREALVMAGSPQPSLSPSSPLLDTLSELQTLDSPEIPDFDTRVQREMTQLQCGKPSAVKTSSRPPKRRRTEVETLMSASPVGPVADPCSDSSTSPALVSTGPATSSTPPTPSCRPAETPTASSVTSSVPVSVPTPSQVTPAEHSAPPTARRASSGVPRPPSPPSPKVAAPAKSPRRLTLEEMFGSGEDSDGCTGSNVGSADGSVGDPSSSGSDGELSVGAPTPAPAAVSTAASAAPPKVSYGHHTPLSFRTHVARLFADCHGPFQRYWACQIHVCHAANRPVARSMVDHDPLGMLLPEELHLFPPPPRGRPPQPTPSWRALKKLLALVDKEPWKEITEAFPDPVSFDPTHPVYKRLMELLRAWQTNGARTLWIRCHWLRLHDYAPSTKTSQDPAHRAAAVKFDTSVKNAWSHRVRTSTDLLREVRRLVAEGWLDSRIFLDPAFLVLPLDHARYYWIPDFSDGAPSLTQQLAALDTADPWRLFYVKRPQDHPVRRYGYTELTQLFPVATPSTYVAVPDGLPTLRTVLGKLLPGNGWRPHLSFEPTSSPPRSTTTPASGDDSDHSTEGLEE